MPLTIGLREILERDREHREWRCGTHMLIASFHYYTIHFWSVTMKTFKKRQEVITYIEELNNSRILAFEDLQEAAVSLARVAESLDVVIDDVAPIFSKVSGDQLKLYHDWCQTPEGKAAAYESELKLNYLNEYFCEQYANDFDDDQLLFLMRHKYIKKINISDFKEEDLEVLLGPLYEMRFKKKKAKVINQ